MKPVLFSGIRPSGTIHIGNYLGAIKNWVNLQNQYFSIFCIVDEHALTTPYKPSELKQNIIDTAILYMACGVLPDKSLIFIQSEVHEHAGLAWILNTITPLGELTRMTQFKEKSGNEKSVLAGLLNYPVLMAADILLYKTNLVPIGEDQKQHLELARTLAKKFNRIFGKTFVIPEAYFTEETKRIMSLDDPTSKMSKSSESASSYISLIDPNELIREKIQKAVTDSGKQIKYDLKNKPAISNLMNIYAGISGFKILEVEKFFEGKNYTEFKRDLTEKLIGFLSPIQEKYEYYRNNKKLVFDILEKGREQAKKIAAETMKEVKEKIGFLI